MSTSDPLSADFERLLDGIPDTFTLQQWQFAYKKVIFAMGLKILEKFPQNAFGPEPIMEERGGGGGQGGGGNPDPMPPQLPIKARGPYAAAGGPWGPGPIIHLAISALDLAPPPPP